MSEIDETKQYDESGELMVLGTIIPAFPAPEPEPLHDPSNPTEDSFARFAVWRRTKCKPRRMADPVQRLDEVDQATAEFVGEVGEFSELILAHGIEVLYDPAHRAKLLDEAGDVFFCGSWAGDAWGANPLLLVKGPPDNLLVGEPLDALITAADKLALFPDDAVTAAGVSRTLMVGALGMACNSALLCNAYKKLRFQRRAQDAQAQAMRIARTLIICGDVLAMANFQIRDALARNIAKLDARYPLGYQSTAPGGGIRTGAGA